LLTKAEKAKATEIARRKRIKAKRLLRAQERKENPLRFKDGDIPPEYMQFLIFMQDCLIPMIDTNTRFTPIYSMYLKYCRALGQEPSITTTGMGKYLGKHFVKQVGQKGAKYFLILRRNVVISSNDVRPEEDDDFNITVVDKDGIEVPLMPEYAEDDDGDEEDDL
jgi:hypothetical protein